MPGVMRRAGLGPDVAVYEETDKTFMAEDMGFLQGEQQWLHCIAGLSPGAVKYQGIDRTFVAEDMGFLQGEHIGLQTPHGSQHCLHALPLPAMLQGWQQKS